MSDWQTQSVNSTALPSAAALPLPLVLIADPDAASCTRRADQLRERGFRVTMARTSFEAIVKASCHLPDLILVDSLLAGDAVDATAELIKTCPATAHIPIIRLSAGRRLPPRVFALAR